MSSAAVVIGALRVKVAFAGEAVIPFSLWAPFSIEINSLRKDPFLERFYFPGKQRGSYKSCSPLKNVVKAGSCIHTL